MGFITNTGKIKTFGDYDYNIPFQSFIFDFNKPFVGVTSYSDERVIYGISFLTYICKKIKVITQPAPVITQPAPVITKPAPVITQPAPVITKPAPVITQPAPLITQPAFVIT